MDHRLFHSWPARSPVSKVSMPDRIPYRSSGDVSNDPDDDPAAATAVTNGERKRKRVWRVLTWIIVANVLLFWLLTVSTAFA